MRRLIFLVYDEGGELGRGAAGKNRGGKMLMALGLRAGRVPGAAWQA